MTGHGFGRQDCLAAVLGGDVLLQARDGIELLSKRFGVGVVGTGVARVGLGQIIGDVIGDLLGGSQTVEHMLVLVGGVCGKKLVCVDPGLAVFEQFVDEWVVSVTVVDHQSGVLDLGGCRGVTSNECGSVSAPLTRALTLA